MGDDNNSIGAAVDTVPDPIYTEKTLLSSFWRPKYRDKGPVFMDTGFMGKPITLDHTLSRTQIPVVHRPVYLLLAKAQL